MSPNLEIVQIIRGVDNTEANARVGLKVSDLLAPLQGAKPKSLPVPQEGNRVSREHTVLSKRAGDCRAIGLQEFEVALGDRGIT